MIRVDTLKSQHPELLKNSYYEDIMLFRHLTEHNQAVEEKGMEKVTVAIAGNLLKGDMSVADIALYPGALVPG